MTQQGDSEYSVSLFLQIKKYILRVARYFYRLAKKKLKAHITQLIGKTMRSWNRYLFPATNHPLINVHPKGYSSTSRLGLHFVFLIALHRLEPPASTT